MISLKKNNKGFTIVELLIVIVVIGILALLVITTYSGIQAKARNAKRQTDLASVQTQLEAFFSQSGYYPSLADMNNNPTWLDTNMKSLDKNALADPSNTGATAIARETLVYGASPAAGVAKSYVYQPLNSAGTSCEADDTTCASYQLIATFEGTVNGSTTDVKKNLD